MQKFLDRLKKMVRLYIIKIKTKGKIYSELEPCKDIELGEEKSCMNLGQGRK